MRKKYRNWYYLSKKGIDIQFIDDILDENYENVKMLKDDNRSLVKIIRIDNKEYVLKVPREKNRRKWQRFINIFRGSDGLRSFLMMEKLEKIGIESTKGILALERRTPLVVDSILIMEVLEGREVEENDFLKVISSLNQIHSKGYLHGDSQIQNFLVKDEKIYSIDLRLQRNIYGSVGKMYEFVYLRESKKDLDKYYDEIRNTISFKLAVLWKKWLYLHGDIRKIIKGKK